MYVSIFETSEILTSGGHLPSKYASYGNANGNSLFDEFNIALSILNNSKLNPDIFNCCPLKSNSILYG